MTLLIAALWVGCLPASAAGDLPPTPSPTPRTGQTRVHAPGDDGTHRAGLPAPEPRFSLLGEGFTLRDNLTGLIWARNADLPDGRMTWTDAVEFCAQLDWGGHRDWRLPTLVELLSLIAWQYTSPALANTRGTAQWEEGEPFRQVRSAAYWTSTSHAYHGSSAWSVFLGDGTVTYAPKGYGYRVWPVRGGITQTTHPEETP